VYADVLRFAESKIGLPYIWGGAGLPGPDCSGLLEWATNELRPGRFPGRQVAASWWTILPKIRKPRPGCTVYWRNRQGKIYHMAVVVAVRGQDVVTIGAHHGDRTCNTPERAAAMQASVCYRTFPLSGVAGFRGWTEDASDIVPKPPEEGSPEPHGNTGEMPEGWV